MTNAGDPTGEESYQYCMETCNGAMATPEEIGDYNPEEKVPSSESITLKMISKRRCGWIVSRQIL